MRDGLKLVNVDTSIKSLKSRILRLEMKVRELTLVFDYNKELNARLTDLEDRVTENGG